MNWSKAVEILSIALPVIVFALLLIDKILDFLRARYGKFKTEPWMVFDVFMDEMRDVIGKAKLSILSVDAIRELAGVFYDSMKETLAPIVDREEFVDFISEQYNKEVVLREAVDAAYQAAVDEQVRLTVAKQAERIA
jgi:hypothetical protein